MALHHFPRSPYEVLSPLVARVRAEAMSFTEYQA
jgi:hypothetical protein